MGKKQPIASAEKLAAILEVMSLVILGTGS
jgi:hypothetical protein